MAIFIMRTLTKSKVRFTGFMVETKGFVYIDRMWEITNHIINVKTLRKRNIALLFFRFGTPKLKT